MTEESNTTSSPRDAVAARCSGCGHLFRVRQWQNGMSCPQCGNSSVEPVMAPGGAVDYCVAKRDDGYARADVRLAQWAKWTNLITPNQYERVFIKQNRQIQRGQTPDPIHDIMVEENWIGREQAIGLLEYLALPRPSESDNEFLRTLRQMDGVNWDKVQKVQKLQRKAVKQCHEVPPVCQLLMEKRIISEAQMLGVLKQLDKSETGDLHKAREMAGERKSTRRLKRLKKTVLPSRTTIRNTAIVLVLLVLGFAAWKWQTNRGPKVTIKCRECSEISRVNWSKSYPVRCPECGRKNGYYAMMCENGHIFTISNPYQRVINCPKCDTSQSHPIREDEIE